MSEVNENKTILFYYLRGISDGGSDHSLYHHLVKINRLKFKPIVLYRNYGGFVSSLKKSKLLVIKDVFLFLEKASKNKIWNNIPFSKTVLFLLRLVFEVPFITLIIIINKVDILHLNHGIKSDIAALMAGLITRKKIIVHYRGLVSLNKLDVYLSKYIQKIICISEFTKQSYVSSGIPPEKCIVVYNGVDTNLFIPKVNSEAKVTIGTVSRLENWKGVDVLIKAASDVIAQFPNIKFLIVGSGSKKNNLENLIDELSLKESVSLLGKIENTIEIYQQLDIFIHSAIEPEPFGRVIIEAMACGLPVISTNMGGPKEIISDGKDGFLIKQGDSNILTQKIIDLINDPELRSNLGNEAIQKVKNKFDINITTRSIEQVYFSLIK